MLLSAHPVLQLREVHRGEMDELVEPESQQCLVVCWAPCSHPFRTEVTIAGSAGGVRGSGGDVSAAQSGSGVGAGCSGGSLWLMVKPSWTAGGSSAGTTGGGGPGATIESASLLVSLLVSSPSRTGVVSCRSAGGVSSGFGAGATG